MVENLNKKKNLIIIHFSKTAIEKNEIKCNRKEKKKTRKGKKC